MKKIILKIVVIILKIIYIPIRLFKIQNKVTYISRQSNKESIDFKLIRKMVEDKYPDTKNVVLTKKIEKGIWDKLKYAIHMIAQMYHISTSKVVILDTYCIVASILKHKKDTKIIQIWHALSAVKKFGYQTIGKEAGSDRITAEIMCMHKNYDYVLAPSEITAKYYKEAFRVSDKQIKYIGMPRIDYILNKDEDIKNKLYEKYPELKEKINILYVPTFRKKEKIKIDELVEKIDTNKYNLIIKMHPLDMEAYKYKQKEGIIYEKSFNTYDLLKVVDKIITDYSSLAMEVSLLNIPLYFYTYDIEEYKNTSGLNFEFNKEEIGMYQTTTVDDLLMKIEQNYDFEILERFRKKYISVDVNNCTERLVNFMMGGKDES